MKLKDLYQRLLKSYTIKNLNSISLTLINLYKKKQFSDLQNIAETISDFFKIEILSNGKGFSKLITLYHPDRLNYYLKQINSLYEKKDFKQLFKYSHIFELDRIDGISNSLINYEEIDYSPVYNWDFSNDGYNIFNKTKKSHQVHTKIIDNNFYDAVKIRQYGNKNIEFPSYYLEDLEELELSSSNINDLEGIQFCLQTKTMDLSENRIVELKMLENLVCIEELNLSDNNIVNIDSLSFLMNLKRLYLSNNNITDISPIFKLENLDFVDLLGNNIPKEQIEELMNLNVNVNI